MKYLTICLYICITLAGTDAYTQCFPNRHNTSPDASWISCTPSANPNSTRGISHWISYDLGDITSLGHMHFWNLNSPEYLDAGAKDIAIDYSTNGTTWSQWGTYTLEMANASGYYEGHQGPDLDGLQARYILLTILNTHGNTCTGLGEIKIETRPTTAVTIIDNSLPSKLYPNPAHTNTLLSFTSPTTTQGQMTLSNTQGQTLIQTRLRINEGEEAIKVNLQDMTPGVYHIRVTTPEYSIHKEVTVVTNP